MKDQWDQDATLMERAFTWLIRWSGTVFATIVITYLLLLLYFNFIR